MSRVRFSANRFFGAKLAPGAVPDSSTAAAQFHRGLSGYAPTPLVSLPALASELGVREIWVKDESKRFGLNAFKVLGASYAIWRFLSKRPPYDPDGDTSKIERYTFATATDGNHGRAVAWTAKSLGHRAVIFVPKNTVAARIDAIRGEGAEVIVVDGNYDDTVKQCAATATERRWQVISDTAYPGYEEIPRWIMEGYTTLFMECAEQMSAAGNRWPTHVLLQAGVGGLACAGAFFFAMRRGGAVPSLISVEPTDADCLLESILSPEGEIRIAKGKQDSIMAGLNCGTPSLIAWPVIRAKFRFFLAVDDDFAREAMRILAAGKGGDAKVVSGESGAAGLAGLMALCQEPELAASRAELGLGKDATVLLVSTEGDTDPVSYRKIVGE